MEFFKPTGKKLLIAIVLTIWPYVASLLFVLHAGDGSLTSDPILQSSFWFHSWYFSPLYFIVQLIPHHKSNFFWQSNTFNFFVYPFLRFSIRYVVACTIIFYANKLIKKHAKPKQKVSSSLNTTDN